MSTRLLIPHFCRRAVAYAVAMIVLPVCVNNPSNAVAGDAAEKPNILLIVADDLGYADVGFHGGKEIPTPYIDSIAAGGVQFTNGYVTCPVCSPTRAGLLTGRYQQRFGHEFNPGGVNQKKSDELGLPLSETTIADALRDAGYRTAVIGKWHLGADPKRHPLRRGFDHFYGFLGGAHPYVPTGKGGQARGAIYRDDAQLDAPAHLTTEFGKRAAEYISEKNDKPFFLYLTFNAVHNPLQPDEKHLARFAKIQDPQRRSYAALLSGLDDAIGSVLTALKESRKLEDTLIFFVSDNGGPQDKNGSKNTPLSGDKGTVLEGGIRVPFVVRWQGRLPAGKKIDSPVNSLDIPATAATAGGAQLGSDEKKIDGIDLIPYITGDAKGDPHKSLFWRFGTQRAIRQGDYKLRQQGDEPPQLFNLPNDIGETKDISSEHPELLKKLNAAYAEWNSQLAEPLWKAGKSSAKNSARPSRRAAKDSDERDL